MKNLHQIFLSLLIVNSAFIQTSDRTVDACFFNDEIEEKSLELENKIYQISIKRVKDFFKKKENRIQTKAKIYEPEINLPSQFDTPDEVHLPSDAQDFLSIVLEFHEKRYSIDSTAKKELQNHINQIYPILFSEEITQEDLNLVRENMLYAKAAATKIQKITRGFLDRKVFVVPLDEEKRAYLEENKNYFGHCDNHSSDSETSSNTGDLKRQKQINQTLQRNRVSQAYFNDLAQSITYQKEEDA